MAINPTCERGARWLPGDEERWRAYLDVDENLHEPAEVVIVCPCL